MIKSGGKSQVHFRVMQNLLTRFDSTRVRRVESSYFSSRVITRSIPSVQTHLQRYLDNQLRLINRQVY